MRYGCSPGICYLAFLKHVPVLWVRSRPREIGWLGQGQYRHLERTVPLTHAYLCKTMRAILPWLSIHAHLINGFQILHWQIPYFPLDRLCLSFLRYNQIWTWTPDWVHSWEVSSLCLKISIHLPSLKTLFPGLGMTQWLWALSAFSEDLGSIPSIHMMTHNHL